MIQQGPADVVRDNGIYLLMEDVTVKSCKEAIHWILEENLKEKKKTIPTTDDQLTRRRRVCLLLTDRHNEGI